MTVNPRAADGGMPSRKGPIPRLAKALLFLFISMFGLLGIRLIPSTFAGGWKPAVTLLVALGLIAIVLIEVVRTQKR
jgi:hypothetical protein